eukprot:11177972-Lingulodinium_polyedra.AAC.1
MGCHPQSNSAGGGGLLPCRPNVALTSCALPSRPRRAARRGELRPATSPTGLRACLDRGNH